LLLAEAPVPNMKDFNMATEPFSGAAAIAALKVAGVAAFIGALGGAIMALFDPPATRRELFIQAAVAGTGSLIFGHVGAAAAAHYLTFIPADDARIPAYFLVGAVSWGAFGFLAKVRRGLSEKVADKVIDKVSK
jgi:hypothetical protein